MHHYFGQQHPGTTDLFDSRSGVGWYHTVEVAEFPHYRLLAGDPQAYVDYLERSWPFYGIPLDDIPARVERFKCLARDIAAAGRNSVPVRLTRRFDGRTIVIDGNHRVSVCRHLGVEPLAEFVDLREHVADLARNDGEFYGTGHRNMPYQSVTAEDGTLIEGRRTDIEERSRMIDPEDVRGRTVVDFGCNLGMALHCVARHGFREAVGVESSRAITLAAIRLNVVFARPIRFRLHDLAQPLDLGCRHDTGFAFSIDRHVKDDAALADNLRRNVSRVVYFETHANDDIPPPIASIFRQIDFRGDTFAGRRLFKCWL